MSQAKSIKTITLKRLIAAAFVVILFIIFFVAYNFRELTISAMTDKGRSVARFVEAGLMTHMRVSTHEEKEQYLQNIQKVSEVQNLQIIHSASVTKQFNLANHENRFQDPTIAQVFKTKQPIIKLVTHGDKKNMLRITFPYIAESKLGVDCTQCHNVAKGSVLGAIDFYIDVEHYKEMSVEYLYIILAILTLILFAIMVMMFRIIDRHIKHPLDELMNDTKRSYESHIPIKMLESFFELKCLITIIWSGIIGIIDVAFIGNVYSSDCINDLFKSIEIQYGIIMNIKGGHIFHCAEEWFDGLAFIFGIIET